MSDYEVFVFERFRRHRRIASLMKQLGTFEISVAALMSDDKDRAEEELYDIVCADPTLQPVLRQFGATRETLRTVFRDLAHVGAGQWESGVYVPVAALTEASTLGFILRRAEPHGDSFERAWALIATGLLGYFRTRDPRYLSP